MSGEISERFQAQGQVSGSVPVGNSKPQFTDDTTA